MRWVYIAIAALLGIIFLRGDTQLLDLIIKADLRWSLAGALFLGGILAGQYFVGYKPRTNTWKLARWGIFVTMLLGLLEYSIEWNKQTLIADNQTIVLSAASLESVEQHFVTARDGLFLTEVTFNSAISEALIDTGASLVLLNYTTAKAAGIDVENLSFSTPVLTASGTLKIAEITLENVRIGKGIVAKNVKAAVTPKGSDHSNLLGASFLTQLDETVIRNDKLILRQKH